MVHFLIRIRFRQPTAVLMDADYITPKSRRLRLDACSRKRCCIYVPISIDGLVVAPEASGSSILVSVVTSFKPSTVTSTTQTSASSLTTDAALIASSTVEIMNPTPTSSWDSPRKEDYTLTTDDKVAIGIGIPIALLVLGTIGWWRAAKFFAHRKITGELKLPVYGSVHGSTPTVVIGSGLMRESGRQASRTPSLWGASSRRSVNDRDAAPLHQTEQVIVTPPSPVGRPASPSATLSPPGTASSSRTTDPTLAGRVPSGLRQAWMPE